jgi:hypothetical protein
MRAMKNGWGKKGKVALAGVLWLLTGFVGAGVAWADHDGRGYERDRCYEGDCSDQEYDQWNSEQRNHNGRERGAFSPGPFDDSPVDAFNGVCMPGATCHYDGDGRQRDGSENPREPGGQR